MKFLLKLCRTLNNDFISGIGMESDCHLQIHRLKLSSCWNRVSTQKGLEMADNYIMNLCLTFVYLTICPINKESLVLQVLDHSILMLEMVSLTRPVAACRFKSEG